MTNTQGNPRWAAVIVAAVLMTLAASAAPAPAQTYSVVYTFTGGADGAFPYAGLIRDAAGNLYGTTPYDNVFTGREDGAGPQAGLIRDNAGILYGTTSGGGDLSCGFGSGCGVVFKLDPATGTETALYSFGGAADGAYPTAGLLPYQGALYGTAQYGGINVGTKGFGVVFKISLR